MFIIKIHEITLWKHQTNIYVTIVLMKLYADKVDKLLNDIIIEITSMSDFVEKGKHCCQY